MTSLITSLMLLDSLSKAVTDMARPKKEGKTVSLLMDKDLFEQLEAYCEKTYLTKTAAIEKALRTMFDKETEDKNKQP